jgi:hypothetical protein
MSAKYPKDIVNDMKNLFPWYDSNWLSSYVHAKNCIRTHYPSKYKKFLDVLAPLRTRLDFETIRISDIFDAETLVEIKKLIVKSKHEELEKHEFFTFGRMVIHNHPYFDRLQNLLTTLVSDRVGEDVEPSYNFLSLYNNLGVCDIHMDAPKVKYTLDICIEQSNPWPISISQVQPWPEQFKYHQGWEETIKNDPNNKFISDTLHAGEAIIFSGSSQWHYRERIPKKTDNNFCHLIFFHFIPKGMSQILKPKNWAALFDIPELNNVILQSPSRVDRSILSLN